MEEDGGQDSIIKAEGILDVMHGILAERSLTYNDNKAVIACIMCFQKHIYELKKLQPPLKSTDDIARRRYAIHDLKDCTRRAEQLLPHLQRMVPSMPLAKNTIPSPARQQSAFQTIVPQPPITTNVDKLERPIKVFFSYASDAEEDTNYTHSFDTEKDTNYLLQIIKQLSTLKRDGLIDLWYDKELPLGAGNRDGTEQHLKEAEIILLLISPDYIASDTAYSQLKLAMKKKDRTEVILILLKPIDLPSEVREAGLRQLPPDGIPVTSQRDKNEALHKIEKGIREVVQELRKRVSYSTAVFIEKLPGEQLNVTFAAPEKVPSSKPSPQTPKARRRRSDVLLVTAKLEETLSLIRACEQASGSPFERVPVKGQSMYYNLHMIEGTQTFLVQTEQGDKGSGGSTLTAHDAIQHLKPSAVILVGVAFGMHIKDQQMGHILVSRQILDYEVQRIDEDGNGAIHIRQRGNRSQASQYLLSLVNSGLVDWKEPKVHLGLMFSGDKMANSITFRNLLHDFEPEGIGGEMEGAGLYAAAERNHIDWIIIKGISDWADGEVNNDKSERQRVAAENAARFVTHILQQGGLARTP